MARALSYDQIVLISLDTLRSDCVSISPYRLWPTKYPELNWPGAPELDSLAVSGAFFPWTISAAPYTSASHASILTGRWPAHHGVYEFFRQGLCSPTVFTRAKGAGYATLLKVDFPVILGSALGFDRDVDRYLIEEDDAALRLIASAEKALSVVHFGGIHIPYGFHNIRFGREAYREKVRELERELPPDTPLSRDSLTETFRNPEDADLLSRYKRVVGHFYHTGQYGRLFSLYLEGVEYFCHNRLAPFLARLMEALRGKRWLLVVFGDHGEEYDERSYGHFDSLAEGVLRVPTIMAGSDVIPGIRHDRIRTIDIGATVLHAIGDRAYARRMVDGISLLDTIHGGAAPEPQIAFSQAYIPETQAHVKFQRSLLQGQDNDGSLPHYLFQEAVYADTWKLTRWNFSYGPDGCFGPIFPKQPRRLLERVTGPKIVPATEEAAEAEMEAILDGYNRQRKYF
jgi:choline-sulfatase